MEGYILLAIYIISFVVAWIMIRQEEDEYNFGHIFLVVFPIANTLTGLILCAMYLDRFNCNWFFLKKDKKRDWRY